LPRCLEALVRHDAIIAENNLNRILLADARFTGLDEIVAHGVGA
jgi:hypothetical protein